MNMQKLHTFYLCALIAPFLVATPAYGIFGFGKQETTTNDAIVKAATAAETVGKAVQDAAKTGIDVRVTAPKPEDITKVVDAGVNALNKANVTVGLTLPTSENASQFAGAAGDALANSLKNTTINVKVGELPQFPPLAHAVTVSEIKLDHFSNYKAVLKTCTLYCGSLMFGGLGLKLLYDMAVNKEKRDLFTGSLAGGSLVGAAALFWYASKI